MSRRRRMIEDEQREAMQRMGNGAGNGAGGAASPFAASPFDLLFGGGMFGGVRSYELDPQTGRWVEVTDERPVPAQEPSPAESEAEEPPASPAEARRRKRAERLAQRPQQPQNPLAGLLGGGMMGGGMGGGGGDFEVQPPDELVDFAEVGGMDT